MKYRAEIDGLRALAVIPVILFHAGFELFSGGFTGVDVFFVISGYLITTILIEDIENKRFSIVNFYERRARRILPALFFMMLVCIPFAWMWMLPSQMKDFSQSLVAASLFASNILFWRESGYFDAAAEEKPLLHTWSLAVEEQYYFLFPIFLILAWRFGKNRVFWMIVVMAVISLILSEWSWRNKATANFYLAPTRAWELFAGSIAAFIVQKQGVKKNNALALTGLVAIIFSIFFYNETTPFPSVYALVPVLGVVLLVLYADKETIAAKLLSAKGFVGIGLISYSAYLWHQPLLAFARIKSGNEPSYVLMIVLTICSMVLAYFSWKYIETPFRNKSKIGRARVFSISLFGIALFASVGLFVYKLDGFSHRLEIYQLEILKWEQYPREPAYREGSCFLRPEQNFHGFNSECTQDDANLLIWGDSHAAALASGWRHIEPVHQLTASACPPILDRDFASRPHCREINTYIEGMIASNRYSVVVLHANWKNRSVADIESLAETISRLKGLGVQSIYVIGGMPQYQPSLPKRLLTARIKLAEIDYIIYPQTEIVNRDIVLQGEILNSNAIFLRPIDFLCRENQCKATHEYNDTQYPLAWDYGHLTEGGAVYIAKRLIDLMKHE